MPHDKYTPPTSKQIITLLLLIMTISLWFTQNSVNAYWQQTYHTPSPLEKLNNSTLWQSGANLFTYTNSQYNLLLDKYNQDNEQWMTQHKPQETANIISTKINVKSDTQITKTDVINTSEETSTTVANNTAAIRESSTEDTNIIPNAPNHTPIAIPNQGQIVLHSGDKVFFAGDSLMQGVAPWVEQNLKKSYGIKSVNLSKQSTGLSYPSFFNWPKTIEKTLANDKSIRLLVMFLGPNDPWDFPHPNKSKGAPYLKFASPEWEQIYRSRIDLIYQTALKNNVQIIWLGIPYMKNPKLNSQVGYLDSIIAKELGTKVILLPTKQLLSNNANQYTDSATVNGKSNVVRSKDGVHFTSKGQQLLASYILTHITYQAETNAEHATKATTPEAQEEEDSDNDEE